jgi:putative phosphoesterase
MKSLVISDIHDHIKNLKAALQVANTASCDSIICCGDLCSPFILDLIHKNYELPVHIVFGNNDGDQFHLNQKAELLNHHRRPHCHIQLHGQFIIAEKGHKLHGIAPLARIAVYHYPQMAEVLAKSGLFDFVFYGHNHKSSIETLGTCLLANPGSIMGYDPANPDEPVKPSCLIVNFETRELELIEL